MTHASLIAAIIEDASDRNTARLFKNASGMATRKRKDGKPSVIKYGVGPSGGGGHDLIGWRMSDGKFISIDAKVGRDKLSDAQIKWMNWVIHGGGLSGEARSVEDARRIIEG